MEESESKPQTHPTIDAIPPQDKASPKTSQPPIGSGPPVNPNVVVTDGNQEQSRHCRPDQTPVMKIVLEVLGVVILAAYTIAAFRQLGVMSRQLTEMQEARKQAKTDNANAIAAQQGIAQDSLTKSQGNFDTSSQSAENTFRDEQRAWVGAIFVTDIVIKEGEIPSFHVRATNSGKTPALHLRSITSGISRPKGGKIDFTYPAPPEPQLNSKFVLQPGVQYTLNVGGQPPTLPATKPQVDAVTSGVNWFWVYGKITYEDVSKRTHHTKWCFIISPDLNGGQPCDTYNEAD